MSDNDNLTNIKSLETNDNIEETTLIRPEESEVFPASSASNSHKKKVRTSRRDSYIYKMSLLALLSTLAYLLHFFQIKAFSFLTYEPKNFIVALTSVILGPQYGIVVAFLAAFLELITTSDTGMYGFLMNFVAGVAFSIPIGLVFNIKRNRLFLALGVITGTVSLTALMTLLNLGITPLFMHTSVNEVVKLLPVAIVPFNFIKGVIDSCLIFAFFPNLLKQLKIISVTYEQEKTKKNKILNIVYMIIGLLLIAAAITFLVLMYLGIIGM